MAVFGPLTVRSPGRASVTYHYTADGGATFVEVADAQYGTFFDVVPGTTGEDTKQSGKPSHASVLMEPYLTAFPADLSKVDSISVQPRTFTDTIVDDTYSVGLKIVHGTTDYTNELLFHRTTNGLLTHDAQTFTLTAAGAAATKAEWDAVVLLARGYQHLGVMAGDGSRILIASLRVDGTYTATATSDTTAPVVTLGTVTKTKISRVVGADATEVSFTSDEAYNAYEVHVVAGATTPRPTTTTSLIESGTGAAANTTVTITVTDDELVAAGGISGDNIVKVYTQDAAGNWSA